MAALLITAGSVLSSYAKQAAKTKKGSHVTGWCCADGKIFKSTRSRCKGHFFKDRNSAKAYLNAQTKGWCCTDGKVASLKKEDCQGINGLFFENKAAATHYCEINQPGYCCINGKVVKTVRGKCQEAKGRFFEKKGAALLYCEMNQPGYCCINHKVSLMKKGDCFKKKGIFFKDKQAASRVCEPMGWCLLNGRIVETTYRKCLARRGRFFKKKAEAEKTLSVRKYSPAPAASKKTTLLAQAPPLLSIVRIYLKGGTLHIRVRNRGKGKLTAGDYRHGKLVLHHGGRAKSWRLKGIDPKKLLAKPGGMLDFDTELVLKKSEKIQVAFKKVKAKAFKPTIISPKTHPTMQASKPSILQAEGKHLPGKLFSPGDGPNLIVTEVSFLPRYFSPGDAVTLSYKVKNIGTLTVLDAFNVHIWFGNSLVHSQHVNPPLPSSVSTELLSYTFASAPCGKEIRIEADANHRIDESDEDNTWSDTMTCQQIATEEYIPPPNMVIFPRKGSILVQGNTYTLKWTDNFHNSEEGFFVLLMGVRYELISEELHGTSFTWQVPEIPSGNYRIEIRKGDWNYLTVSDRFEIVTYKPDLIIRNMEIEEDETQGLITVKALIENNSLGSAGPSKAKLAISGPRFQKEFDDINIPSLNYGVHYLLEKSYNYPAAGEYHHTLEIDTNNDVDESNESNNEDRKTFSAHRANNLPDLVVCICSEIWAKLNRHVRIPVYVRNMGTVRSPPSKLCIWIEKCGGKCYDIPELDPYTGGDGYKCDQRQEYWIMPGVREYHARIDPDNLIMETNEANNCVKGYIYKRLHTYRDFDDTVYFYPLTCSEARSCW